MYNCMPSWPTDPNFLYEMTKNTARDGFTKHIIHQMTTHTGTHIDTPLHFISEGKSVDQLPIEVFMGDGVVIDLSHKGEREEITARDLKVYDEEILKGDVLMLHTGWDKRRGFNPEYLFEWPYLVEETARYLVKKEVKALGVDTLSVGGWSENMPGHEAIARRNSPAETHRILLEAEIILIEVLRNLDKILDGARTKRGYFIYAPIAIEGTEGSPCRALALLF